MVFLNPAILLGLLAASIPIIIHILNFRKLKKVDFSTLAFLKELQKSKIKKIKIKQWLLLLIRTLIIVCLVLAFARPTIESVSIVGGSSSAKSSTVFIIDNSFSMNYIGSEGTLFNRSKKHLKDIILEMEEGDELILLVSEDSSMTTSNKNTFIKYLDNYTTSLSTESLHSKLETASELLNQSQNINKEIFLFSDFQLSTFNSNENLDSITNNFNSENIRLYSFDMSIANTSNYSVSNLKLENSILELNKPISFSADLNNYSNSVVSNLTASLFINDKRVAQQSVDLEAGSGKTIKFTASLTKRGYNETKVVLEQDNILEDNTSYHSFLVPELIKVLLLYDNESDIVFVETALNSISSSDQLEIVKANSLTRRNYNFENFDVLVWIGSENTRTSQIKEFLTAGGKLIYLPPSSFQEKGLNFLNEELKFPIVQKIISSDPNKLTYTEFGEIELRHPIFQSLFQNQSKTDFESPNIFRYLKFNRSISFNSIINLFDGSVFLGEYNFDKGKVMFFNISPTLNWSDFPIKGIFAPLFSRMVHYITANNDQNFSYLVGDKINIDVSNLTFPLIDIDLPLGEDNLNVQKNQSDNILYSNTKQIGSYKFFNNNKLIYFADVNSNPNESDLTKIKDEMLFEYYNNIFGNNFLILNPDEVYLEKIGQARFGTELWNYLLMAALLLAIIEMYISRSAKKDLMTLN